MKSFLKRGVVALLVLVLPALIGFTAPKYQEAPMLARLVAAGKLPPVDQRLPDVPVVCGPGVMNATQWLDWTPGKYSDGKTCRTVSSVYKMGILGVGEINFLWAPDQTTKDPIPVIVENFSYSPDYKVFNFTLRKGLKWSNGDEVTTEDIRFPIEDLYQNPDTGIAYPSSLHSQGNTMYGVVKLTIKDKYSFTYTFDRPYGYFIADLISWITDYNYYIQPSKFLKGYHPKYTSMATLNSMAKKEGLVDWKQLLQAKTAGHWADHNGDPHRIGVPSLQPYILVGTGETVVRVERNPYFYWVDTEGKQLPYIDAFESTVIKDSDALTVKIVSGGVDFGAGDECFRLNKMPLYILGAEKAGYHVQLAGSFNSPPLLSINQDYDYKKPNSQWQKLMQDPQHRFGKAVALAIDKNDINNTLYFGKYGMNDLVTTATYDPAQANQLLDQLGMKKDARGFRRYPDGSPLVITIAANTASPDQPEMALLLAKYLQAVGLDVSAKAVESGIFNQKGSNNEYQMTVMWTDGPAWVPGISQDYWPAWKGMWAPACGLYVDSQGKQGRKPPAYLQQFFDLHTQRKAVPPETPEGAARMAKLLDWFANNYVMIWPVGKVVAPVIVSNNLRNFPPSDDYPIVFGSDAACPQWYFNQP